MSDAYEVLLKLTVSKTRTLKKIIYKEMMKKLDNLNFFSTCFLNFILMK